MKYLFLAIAYCMLLASCGDKSTNGGDSLETIKIGDTYWAIKNLDVDHYRNGDKIPEVTDSTEWSNLTTGAWCYYKNDPEMGKIYGKLYNWYAVNDIRGLAPDGYHVSTEGDWNSLIKFLGGDTLAGGALKDAGTNYWITPNAGATNSSGFTALPGGGRDTNGYFMTNKYYAAFWTSTQSTVTKAFYHSLSHMTKQVYLIDYNKHSGFSVRCVKD